MIPNQWYAVLESREVRLGKVTAATRLGERLVFWRDADGQLGCLRDRCPHRGVALRAGKVVGDHLQCPFHGFEFDPAGACQLIPANGRDAKVPRAMRAVSYPVREAHGLVYLWWGAPRHSYPALPWFEDLGDELVYATTRDTWATHYSRVIENQLDVVHLPFIHHNTIGRGNKTVVNGPIERHTNAREGDHLLELWVDNARDEGQAPRHSRDDAPPPRHPNLQFRFPNIWHNWVSDRIRVFIAFAPVDERTTLLYMRYYHRVRLPILRHLVGWAGSVANRVIERQDKRVVVTHEPARSELHGDEQLIRGDGPVITYRRVRQRLLDAAP